jgi:hypothetical protein
MEGWGMNCHLEVEDKDAVSHHTRQLQTKNTPAPNISSAEADSSTAAVLRREFCNVDVLCQVRAQTQATGSTPLSCALHCPFPLYSFLSEVKQGRMLMQF